MGARDVSATATHPSDPRTSSFRTTPFPGQLPSSRLLAANLLNQFSTRGVGGKCYSFPVGFLFQEERAPVPAKILGGQAVWKVQ